MKIRPVILCGGAGTRLWSESKNNTAKQFIDFGGWCLFEKALERIQNKIFDYPIISTNSKYLKDVKKNLKKKGFKKYKIILEPIKKNTAPAILASALIKEIPLEQPLMYFSSDHLIEKFSLLKESINKNKKKLDKQNIFIFGIKPINPSTQFGYFLSTRKKGINVVTKFIEKPSLLKAKKIILKKGYWNSGMFFVRKDSIINNFKMHQPKTFNNCVRSLANSKYKKNIYFLNKNYFSKTTANSFDYAILEKSKKINAIKLDVPWSDLGSWREISKMYNNNKRKYSNKQNTFYRPWGKYVNLHKGKGFLVKELFVKPKGCLSLQKHYHRREHWFITQGNPEITLNKNIFIRKSNQSVFIPKGAIHRINNPFKEPVKIIEIQLGTILKETDIVRYQDIYGRVK